MRLFWLLLGLAVALALALGVTLGGVALPGSGPLAAATPTAMALATVDAGTTPSPPEATAMEATPSTAAPAKPTPSAPLGLPGSAAPPPAATAATTPPVTETPSSPLPQQTLVEAMAVERPLRDLNDLGVRLKGLPPTVATPAAGAATSGYEVGRRDVFWVSDQKAKTYFTVTATIAYVTPHAYFYVQDGERVSPDALRQSAESFENRTYPLVRRYFGAERPGVNGDPRVTILNARVPNVGGYFSSDDQYPRAASPRSNERNIIYINTGAYTPGTRSYDSTVAHEFQHLVSWSVNRIADTWFNEGSSELAMRLAGYDPGGVEAGYAADPNTQLTGWSEDDGKVLAHYGAGYLFLSYFGEHYGGYEALPELLAAGGRGSEPFDRYLAKRGYNANFDDVFRDWVVANYLDDPEVADGRYGYNDVNLHAKGERIERYPARRSATVEQYGARYFELPAASGDVTIEITGTTTNKLLDNDAKSGRMQWWSNRGDLMDTTLTREFDLSGLSEATLRFWTWYQIEDGFDYAYVAASGDSGRTWTTLAGRYTTPLDPLGHNLGNGYTGKSGGGQRPQWIEEAVDLSAYTGKKVLIRFEYVTDDAFNAPGFAVDDVKVPELGFEDDAEGGDNGWQAIGFVRTANVIPQRYSVQLIAIGPQTNVETLTLDAEGRGRLRTNGLGKTYERAALVIAPMTPVTSEPAPFELSVSPR